MEKPEETANSWKTIRRKLFRMVSVGVVDEIVNQSYDVLSTSALLLNLIAAVLYTFQSVRAQYGAVLLTIEAVTVFFFAVDYVLRLLTAPCLYPNVSERKAVLRYVFSAAGVIDLMSFLPYYLPVFFPTGAAVFRIFRVIRILRLFRINAYYDSLNVITEVLVRKKQQLLSSLFIILVMMLASSLCMYSVENQAQPEVFSNAFSGIWWAASTLLTVGYGDIYPITNLGKGIGIIITFLGCGMVAIPTGIISAGFVEQYTRLQKLGDYAREQDVHFIKIRLKRRDTWAGKEIRQLGLPAGAIIAAVIRGNRTLIPRGDLILLAGDQMIIGAEALKGDRLDHVKEVTLRRNHPWNGKSVRDLDISRQSFLVMIKRNGQSIIPRGDTLLVENDTVFLYEHVSPEDQEELPEGEGGEDEEV